MLALTSVLLAAALLAQNPVAPDAPGTSAPAGPGGPPLAAEAPPDPVDLAGLIAELSDRRAPTRFPRPAFQSRFQSAPEPQAVGAAGSRVQLEFEGPGALVRVSALTPTGRLLIQLDGAETPVVDEPLAELLSGAGSLPGPFASAHPGGASALLPVPFSERCRVTCDATAALTVQWRSYPADTAVHSMSAGDLSAAGPALAAAGEALARFQYGHGAQSFKFGKVISYSGTGGTSRWAAMSIAAGDSGPHVVSELRIGPLTADNPEQLQQLLRRTLISITFDGFETVLMPLGDFFGAAPGLAPLSTPALSVSPEGLYTCRWPMPYRETCFIKIEAQMDLPFGVPSTVTVEPREWTEDTLYFQTSWRHEPYLETPPTRTWTLAEIAGRGILVAESLTVGSSDATWRAGRARIVSDGRGHRTAGLLEGLALPLGCTEPWWTALSSAALCTAPEGHGWTSLLRTRSLDAVPFTSELRYELDVDFTDVPLRSYAATAWFYAEAEARVARDEATELAGLGITAPE